MTPHTPPEWAGLESFVDDLRRLEAPRTLPHTHATAATPQDALSITGRARPHGTSAGWRVRLSWVALGMAAGVVAVLGWRVVTAPLGTTGVADGSDRRDRRVATRPSADRDDAAPARTTATPAPEPSDPRRAFRAMLSPWPAVAWAQDVERAPAERYAPLTGLDPSRLRPGRRVYVRLSANDYHGILPHQTWSNTLDSVRYRGARAWRLIRQIESRDLAGGASFLEDTLWLRATDLRPLARHTSQAGSIAVAYRFTDTTAISYDTIRMPGGALRSVLPAGRRQVPTTFGNTQTISAHAPFVASAEMLRLLLRAAPLRAGWRASVQVPRWRFNAGIDNASGWVNLRVAGADTVQLFSGRFPAWRVVVESKGPPETWFVSQQTGETLITDGPLDASYPESRTLLLYGLEETARVAPVRRR